MIDGDKGEPKRRYRRPPGMTTFLKRIVTEIGKCEMCGADKRLQGHHVKPYASHPEMGFVRENIQVLCRPCHGLQHPEYERLINSEYHGERVTITCGRCKKDFSVWPHMANRQYCNDTCQFEAMIDGRKRRITVLCAVCETPFEIKKSHESMIKCCGKKCSSINQSRVRKALRPLKMKTITCEECGNERTGPAWSMQRAPRFCSQECSGIAGARKRWHSD